MARPSFSVGINGVHSWNDYYQGQLTATVINARYAAEYVSGVQRRLPDGWKEPTPYRFERTVWKHLNGTCKVERFDPKYNELHTGYITGNTSNYWNNTYLENKSFTSHRDRALVKARLAMKDTSVNLGVAFAERNKTARMVGDNAIQLAKAMMKLRRKDWKGAARELGIYKPGKPRGKSVTDRWLELQYGWKPLLSDVYGATEALAKRPHSDWRVTGKGSSVDHIDNLHVEGLNQDRCETRCTGLRGSFVRIDAVPENDLLIALSALGITNPLFVGWELVPYSFVIDWFLPIGTFLDSLDAMLGYGATSTSLTNFSKLRWDTVGIPQPTHNMPYWYRSTNLTSGYKRYVWVDRTVSDTVPLPTLPRFKDPRSLAHMANGLSLLASAFSSGRR